MAEPQFFLGALETFLDGPAQTGRPRQFGEAGAGRSEDEIIGPLGRVLAAAPDQYPALEAVPGGPSNAIRVQSYSLIPFVPSPAAWATQSLSSWASAKPAGSV
jgi:hypothetical protein